MNKDVIMINADGNAKNWLTKVDMMMDLFGILVYVNVKVINHVMLDYENFKWRKRLIEKLALECEDIKSNSIK